MLKEANKIFMLSPPLADQADEKMKQFRSNPFVYTSIRYGTIKFIFPRDVGGFSQIGVSKTD